MVPRYQLVHSCQVAPPSLPSEWLLFSHQIAGCTAGMHKSTNEVASVCWCWKNLRCCLDPLHLPNCSGCSLQAIYQSPLHCLLQVSVILGFLAFYFWGMKEAHTHTHSTAGHWCGGLMIKQALHVGVSKGQNPKHESNSLKVCFKLGKPALSCRQLQTKWDGHRWIRSVNTSNVVKNWSKGLQSCDLGEQNTCVAI